MEDEDDFLLGDLGDASAFIFAASTPMDLAELCERIIIGHCHTIFATAAARRPLVSGGAPAEVDGEEFVPLLPAGLAEAVTREMTARRLWTDESLEFIVRWVTSVVELSAMTRLRRVAPILSDPAIACHLQVLRLFATNLGGALCLHDRPYLAEVTLESSHVPTISIKDCPRLLHLKMKLTSVQCMSVNNCTAIETFMYYESSPMDNVVCTILSECVNLKILHYIVNSQIYAAPLEPCTLRLNGREALLEDIQISHPTIKELMFADGCPRLTNLHLKRCPQLHSVHISKANALCELRLEYINCAPLRVNLGSSEPAKDEKEVEEKSEPRIYIENAAQLRHITIVNVNADYLDSLSSLSDALQTFEISHSIRNTKVPPASELARILRGGCTPLRSLKEFRLDVFNEIDGFVLDESFSLSSLVDLHLSGLIRNVSLALSSVHTVTLEDKDKMPYYMPMNSDDETENDIVDGRVEITMSEGGQFVALILMNLRVRNLHLACPPLTQLASIHSYIPPDELNRLPSVLKNLETVLVKGLPYEACMRAFGHVPHRYF